MVWGHGCVMRVGRDACGGVWGLGSRLKAGTGCK
jgi:hypothetical protein